MDRNMTNNGYRTPYRTMTEDDGRVVLLDGDGFHVATFEDTEHIGEHVGDAIARALNKTGLTIREGDLA